MLAADAPRFGLMVLLSLVSACASPASTPAPQVRVARGAQTSGALEAVCTVDVQGTGIVDVESDYLPRVVACENGAVADEALRAQAVAARSYLYYRLATGDGTIADGQGDQVYTCNNPPGPRHYEAVASTSGEVLLYEGSFVAAFYVAGAIPSAESCLPVDGDNDWSSTERYVTYNWERAGDGLEQSSLGWVSPTNRANRGCQSQNGAHCLAQAGMPYEDILRFYYGMDIEHAVADGACAAPSGLPHGCGLLVQQGALVVDESSPCFFRGCASPGAWQEASEGIEGGSVLTAAVASAARDCFGRWQLSFTEEGEYELEVHIADVGPRVSEAAYLVRHGGEESVALVDQAQAEGWVSLGSFLFAAGSFQSVELSDTAPTDSAGLFVVYDAVRVRPVGGAHDGGPGDEEKGGAPDAGPFVDGGDAEAAGFVDLPPRVLECACARVPSAQASGLFALLLAGFTLRRRRGCS
jgi:hypothetical protein